MQLCKRIENIDTIDRLVPTLIASPIQSASSFCAVGRALHTPCNSWFPMLPLPSPMMPMISITSGTRANGTLAAIARNCSASACCRFAFELAGFATPSATSPFLLETDTVGLGSKVISSSASGEDNVLNINRQTYWNKPALVNTSRPPHVQQTIPSGLFYFHCYEC